MKAKLSPSAAMLAGCYVFLATIWLFGADIICRLTILTGEFSEADSTMFLMCQGMVHVLVTGGLLYYVMARSRRSHADDSVKLQLMTEAVPTAMALADASGMMTYANPAFRRLFNVDAVALKSIPLEALLSPLDASGRGIALIPLDGESTRNLRLRHADSGAVDLQTQIRKLNDQDRDLGWAVSAIDVTATRQQDAVRAIYMRIAATIADGVVVSALTAGDEYPITFVNPAFETITGYSAAECLGRSCRFLQGPDRSQPEIAILREAIAARRPVSVIVRNYRKDGSLFWNSLRIAPVADDAGTYTHYVGIMRDVTSSREDRIRLELLAYQHAVSELPNALHFRELVEHAFANTREELALIRLDAIRFNDITACYGLEVADALIKEVGQRLRTLDHLLVAGQLAENEFAVLVTAAGRTPAEVAATVRRVLTSLFEVPGTSVQIFFSIGVSTGGPRSDAGVVLQQALVALLQSKQTRIGATRFFEASSEKEMRRRVRVTSDLQQALVAKDFTIHYQPKVCLATGLVAGAEGLVRWKHPVFGLQAPSSFISVAEQTGHIIPIGEFTLRAGMRFMTMFNQGRAVPMPLSLNLSPMEVQHSDVLTTLLTIAEETGADPRWITLEVTEGIITERTPETLRKLIGLRDAGFGVAIDDFGTGFSNLRYLADFPITEIKIDRLFIQDITNSRLKRTIVESVVKLGEALGVTVVAEGIETEAECATVAQLGVDHGQGYLFSLPLEEDDFVWLLDNHTRLPAKAAADRAEYMAPRAS